MTCKLNAEPIIIKKKQDDNLLFQAMTELMTAVIISGLVCDWLNEKTPWLRRFFSYQEIYFYYRTSSPRINLSGLVSIILILNTLLGLSPILSY